MNSGTAAPLRQQKFELRREWGSWLQITIVVLGLMLTYGMIRSFHSLLGAGIVIILTLTLAFQSRMGLRITAPFRAMRRWTLTRNKDQLYMMTLATLKSEAADEDKDTKHHTVSFSGAIHTVVEYGSLGSKAERDTLRYQPVFIDGKKQNCTLYLSTDGFREAAYADYPDRGLYMLPLEEAERRVFNLSDVPIQLARIYVIRPGDVQADLQRFEDNVDESLARAALAGDEGSLTRLNLARAATSQRGHSSIDMVYAVTTPLPFRWKENYGYSTYDPKRRRKLISPAEMEGSLPIRAAQYLLAGMASAGAQNPLMLDLLNQAGFLESIFTVHPDDLDEMYRRFVQDVKALEDDKRLPPQSRRFKTVQEMVKGLETLRRGAFPRAGDVGHDWIRTGRTYHRILQVTYSRGDFVREDAWERVAANLNFPAVMSVVTRSLPGRMQTRRLEEKARFQEDVYRARATGYDEGERRAESLNRAIRERDEAYRSQAPLLEGNMFGMVSDADLEVLEDLFGRLRAAFRAEGFETEVIVGKENLPPVLEYMLALRGKVNN